jgi:hypothetical protein
MQRKIGINSLLLVFIFSALFACKNSKKTSETQAIETEKSAVLEEASVEKIDTTKFSQESLEQRNRTVKGLVDSLLFRIERTSCFGKCPTYSITVFNSGYVEYHGKRNVEKIGFYSARVSDEQKELIIQKCKGINFFKLNDRYDANMTDVPSTLLAFQYEDNRKVVVDRADAPPELHIFEKEMDLLLFGLDFIPIEKY